MFLTCAHGPTPFHSHPTLPQHAPFPYSFFSSHSIQPQLNFSHTTLSPTSYCMYSTTTHLFPTILSSSDR
ncbi:uncharacterized protein EI90DRAFT_3055363 [Cantharellus anzutake]|uniref:uncharacterized protein n=1 Tax=Cantharellus anzutake TaxID=1750568 RepID=UPI0019050670|nr:uncharacterized protein EI90DRAFT_3055363 [Cantharellus anzutake]KAF8332367.1 hypothetical protein EI90DRAFT_3055363 [Cantharellus anzutake]